MTRKSRTRQLSPEEKRLWSHVARHVKPMKGRRLPPEPEPAFQPWWAARADRRSSTPIRSGTRYAGSRARRYDSTSSSSTAPATYPISVRVP